MEREPVYLSPSTLSNYLRRFNHQSRSSLPSPLPNTSPTTQSIFVSVDKSPPPQPEIHKAIDEAAHSLSESAFSRVPTVVSSITTGTATEEGDEQRRGRRADRQHRNAIIRVVSPHISFEGVRGRDQKRSLEKERTGGNDDGLWMSP
ncbi:hypothetical protein BJ742DRAFT_778805 [Cladochytrium replicatum]|nr:hypothetical protein BJ742DRAFT_778805 [Cladochytrium replicatum]